jgi:hypothetical protein
MRSSFVKLCAVVVFAVAGLLQASSSAHAQGFFEQLFGATPKSRPMPSLSVPPGQNQGYSQGGFSGTLTPGGRPYPARDTNERRKDRLDENGDEPGERGTYRTLCVRMCDGYYFPISNSTTKKNFYRDQSKCKSTCGGEARLFVTPTTMSISPTASMENLVDLNGAAYAKLPVAFKYRKTLVAGCQCKPEPWSSAELNRHQRYAEAELAAKASVVVAATEAPKDRDSKVAINTSSADKLEPGKSNKGADKGKVQKSTVIVDAVAAQTNIPATDVAMTADADAQAIKSTALRAKSRLRQTQVAINADGVIEPRKSGRSNAKTAQARPGGNNGSTTIVNAAWAKPAKSATSSGSLFGGGMGLGAGGGKYGWPGD